LAADLAQPRRADRTIGADAARRYNHARRRPLRRPRLWADPPLGVGGLYPRRVRSAGESPSLLWLWNALLALAGFLGPDDRLALGGRSPRRNLALLARPAAARPARPGRVGGARGVRRHPALEPRRRTDLAPLHCGHTASTRLHIRGEPPRSHPLP